MLLVVLTFRVCPIKMFPLLYWVADSSDLTSISMVYTDSQKGKNHGTLLSTVDSNSVLAYTTLSCTASSFPSFPQNVPIVIIYGFWLVSCLEYGCISISQKKKVLSTLLSTVDNIPKMDFPQVLLYHIPGFLLVRELIRRNPVSTGTFLGLVCTLYQK